MAYQDDVDNMLDALDEERKRKKASPLQLASAAAGGPRNTSYLPDGTPITDDDGSYLARTPEAAPDAPDNTAGRSQFGLPDLPSKNISTAPNVTAAPLVTPYTPAPRDENAPPMAGYTPAAPPAPAAASPTALGLSNGDLSMGLGALGQYFSRLGAPGLHDRGAAADTLAALPQALQQRQLQQQQIQQNAVAARQQQAYQQWAASPEVQAQIAKLPDALQTAMEGAIRRGDTHTIGYIMAQASRNGLITASSPGAAASGQLPAWAAGLPDGVDANRLAGLPEDIRNRAIRVINGLDPMPSTARNNPINNQVISAVAAAAPGFDPAQAKSAGVMVNRVASGDISNALTAFSTVQRHAGELGQAATALNNGDLAGANKVLNSLGYQTGNSAQVVFGIIKNAYNHELASVLSKGHMTDAEVAQAGAGINENMSPAQIVAAMQAGHKLMQDKMEQQYATSYAAAGKRIDPYFKPYGLQGGPQTHQSAAPQGNAPGTAAPQNAAPQSGGGYPEGTVIRNGAGKEMIRRNGQWVPR